MNGLNTQNLYKRGENMSSNTTLPLANVAKLEGTNIDAYVLAHSNLLVVRENADETKDIVQFNLKRQVLDKINDVDLRLGALTHLDVNENTIVPEPGTVCELVEKNADDIEQILDTIGTSQATVDNPQGTGIQRRLNLLETDTTTFKNTNYHKGKQIEIINARQVSTQAFTAGETIVCNLDAIPGLRISANINEFKPYSYDLEVSLLVKMDNSSLDTKLNGKYAVVNTIFNLNSMYFSNDSKVGVINLPFGDSIFVKFTIGLQNITFENLFMTNMSNYKREDIKINNVILHINEVESIAKTTE